ncbi:cupin domain-containing protein [Dactylosporangium cerinum]|uniref:Cupin domain-containing protein n=1 Tax=Dactylosporangium cerinum TaxID=1434730 RepID=A0ABV9WLP6_9ACTN
MTDGLLVPPGGGRRIQTMTLKAGADQSKIWSTFEAEVPPGFDVGAHLHNQAEEVFYVLEGELDLLAFQPAAPVGGDWRTWESETGATVFRGGPGSFMFVPAGCPHAFFNPGSEPARMLFLVSPSGHELYLQELSELLATPGPPDQAEIAALRLRHDIHQVTPLVNRRGGPDPQRKPA